LSSILGLPVFEISANNLSKYLLVIFLLVWTVRVADNVLRAGDRNPVLRLRQGYGACTLLGVAFYF
jgi:hypothetical protein